ncbi:hypothetical protein ACLOJK_034841 [Asimina triloba]
MEKACASLPSGISVCYNLTWPTISLMKDGLLGDLRFGLAAGQVEKTGRWVSTWGAAAASHHRSIWGYLLAIGMALGGAGRSWPTIAGVLDLAKGLFFICSSCYCSDRLWDGFHAAWNGFFLDSALKPAGLFGCGWPRRTRKLPVGQWVLNWQDLMTVDGRLGYETLDQRDGCSNGAGHGWKLQCCPVARGCVRDLGKKRCCRVFRWVAC